MIERIVGASFRNVELGDRARKRLMQIGSAVGRSIPPVWDDWPDVRAAYRFVTNDRSSEAGILACHAIGRCSCPRY
ncbi:hypothetical protein IVA96_32525 [Bradyrhizobium sp. 159]|nr:hypothetical protein [Bradyrhizobium sp. 159]